jgi:hypothetical protein
LGEGNISAGKSIETLEIQKDEEGSFVQYNVDPQGGGQFKQSWAVRFLKTLC